MTHTHTHTDTHVSPYAHRYTCCKARPAIHSRGGCRKQACSGAMQLSALTNVPCVWHTTCVCITGWARMWGQGRTVCVGSVKTHFSSYAPFVCTQTASGSAADVVCWYGFAGMTNRNRTCTRLQAYADNHLPPRARACVRACVCVSVCASVPLITCDTASGACVCTCVCVCHTHSVCLCVCVCVCVCVSSHTCTAPKTAPTRLGSHTNNLFSPNHP